VVELLSLNLILISRKMAQNVVIVLETIMIKLTNSELKRYIVKWALAEVLGIGLFVTGLLTSNLFWGIPGLILIAISSFGFFANLGVYLKRRVKGE